MTKYKQIDKDYLLYNYELNNPNLQVLLHRWNNSLNSNNPDYTVYSEDDYINESFYCWKTYSRKYLLMLQKYIITNNIDISDIHNILDLGCGIGYTTVGLSAIFTNANIFGTNKKDSTQYIMDNISTDNFNNIMIIDENDTLNFNNIDLVFASEFFEHLDHPIDLLSALIDKYHPKYFITANTFTQPAIGHFSYYYYNNNKYIGRDISKIFNNILRNNNYIKVNTGFWNNRPAVWKLKDKLENKIKLF